MEEKNKLEKAKELYLMLLISDHGYPLQIYRDSILAIGSILRGETKDFSHLPYPLLFPIEENLTGLDLAIAWMQQAIFENMILGCFPKDLFSVLPMNNYAPVNICESVIFNAIGCILLKKDPFSLFLTDEEANIIANRCRELGEEKTLAHLEAAEKILYDALRLSQPQGKENLHSILKSLYYRIQKEDAKEIFRFIFS